MCVLKTPTLGAVWIMDCQGTRGEAGTRYYYKFQLKDDGGGSGDGNSFVCVCVCVFHCSKIYIT